MTTSEPRVYETKHLVYLGKVFDGKALQDAFGEVNIVDGKPSNPIKEVTGKWMYTKRPKVGEVFLVNYAAPNEIFVGGGLGPRHVGYIELADAYRLANDKANAEYQRYKQGDESAHYGKMTLEEVRFMIQKQSKRSRQTTLAIVLEYLLG